MEPRRPAILAAFRDAVAVRILLLLLPALFGLAPASVVAQDSRTPAVTPRHVTAAVPRSWPPQYDVDASGQPIGFAIDVMNKIAERAGLEVTYQVTEEFPRAVDLLNDGKVDIIPNMGILPQRKGNFAFTAPVETLTVSLFVRADTQDLNGVEDLVGRKLAVVEKNIGLFMFGKRQDIHVGVYPDERRALFELLAGHVDAFVYPTPTVSMLLREMGVEDRVKIVGPPLAEVKRGIAVRKGDDRLLVALDRAVVEFVGSPDYRTIYAKWYGKPKTYWTGRRIGMAALFLGAMMAIFATWRYFLMSEMSRRLTVSEERFRAVVDNSPAAILLKNVDGRYVLANKKWHEWFNPAGRDISGKTVYDFYDKAHADVVTAHDREVVESKRPKAREHRTPLADGTVMTSILHKFPVLGADGSVIAIGGISADISDRVKMEAALKESEERYAFAMTGTQEGLWDWNIETGQNYFSPRWKEILGYQGHELEHHVDTFSDAVHPDDRERVWAAVDAHLKRRQPYGVEFRMRRKDGSYVWILSKGQARWDESGRPVRMAGSIADISDRKRAEEALLESRERLRAVIDASPSGITLQDGNGIYLAANRAFADWMNRPSDDIVGHSFSELFPTDAHGMNAVDREVMETGEIRHVDRRLSYGDGVTRDVALYKGPVRAPDGRIVGVSTVHFDVSDRTRIENKLRASEERFRAIVQGQTELIRRIRPDGTRIFANEAYLRYYSLSPSQALGGQSGAAVIDADKALWDSRLEAITPDSPTVEIEVRVLGGKGETRWQHWIDTGIFDAEGRLVEIQGVGRDITERKLAEAALKESERRLSEAQRIARVGNWNWDIVGGGLWWSDEIYRIFGLAPQAFGATYEAFLAAVHPEDRQRVEDVVDRALRRLDPYVIEHRIVLPDGSEKTVLEQGEVSFDQNGEPVRMVGTVQDITERKRIENELRQSREQLRAVIDASPSGIVLLDKECRYLLANGTYASWFGVKPENLVGKTIYEMLPQDAERISASEKRIYETGETVTFDRQVRYPDGKVRDLLATKGPVHSESGEVVSVCSIITDVTEIKQAERKLAELHEHMAHLARLGTMGEMAAELAHEINQPLAAIANYASGSLRRLKEKRVDSDDLAQVMELIASQALRAGEIIRELRGFLKRAEPKKTRLDLRRMIDEVLALFAGAIREGNIALDVKLSNSLPPVTADPVQIQQVLVNLVGNALAAIEAGATAEPRIEIGVAAGDGGEVEIYVQDNGPGISPDALNDIFNPFFTTKPDGMGMGLSISRSIIAGHDGRLWASSRPGHGACLRFTLPLDASDA